MSMGATLDHVSKTYLLGDGSTVKAVQDVTLDFTPGHRTALMGASGSGKSTLLHLIAAIETPDSGTITVGGQVITGLSRQQLADYRSTIGIVFQRFHLLPSVSLLDNVCVPLLGRSSVTDKRERGREVLKAVGLGDRANDLPSQLSGGQQQRVAIARALVVRPRLFLADEPTGNLDSETAADILTLLGELHARYGTTIILATHDAGVASSCDELIHLVDGRATKVGSDVRPPSPRHYRTDSHASSVSAWPRNRSASR